MDNFRKVNWFYVYVAEIYESLTTLRAKRYPMQLTKDLRYMEYEQNFVRNKKIKTNSCHCTV